MTSNELEQTAKVTRPATGKRWVRRGLTALGLLVAYVLSSGPVLAIAFSLREATQNNLFYASMLLYLPLLVWKGGLLDAYLTWWMHLFKTVGPG